MHIKNIVKIIPFKDLRANINVTAGDLDDKAVYVFHSNEFHETFLLK